MRFTLVLSKESPGSIDTLLGGIISFLPPVGAVILAHPALIHSNINKRNREARVLICAQK